MNPLNVILTLTSAIIFGIVYMVGFFVNQQSKSNIFFGVRIPFGYDKREDIILIQRKYRQRFSLMFLGIMILYILLVFILKSYFVSWMVLFIFILLAVLNINYYQAHKIVKSIKKQEGWVLDQGKSEPKVLINRDDDDYYFMGTMYYNPNDPAVLVEKRVGIGWDFNYARIQSKIIMGAILALVIGVIGMTFFLGKLSNDTKILLTDSTLKIEGAYGIEIPYDEIEEVSMLEALPDRMMRTNCYSDGETLLGHFRADVYGKIRVYARDVEGKAVFVKTEKGTILILNEVDAARTEFLYEELQKKLQ